MPGFTAPKLLWVREHEPDVFARTRRVLLPKDWLRLRMTGDAATDCSDASGTLWLDVAKRAWSPAMLDACGLDEAAMPRVFEGNEVTGRLRAEVANAWGVERVPVAAGAGDQAAGAAGAGVVHAGDASLALGTSGVLFVAGDRFQPNPARAVHAFCHCLPGRWHQMSVLLSRGELSQLGDEAHRRGGRSRAARRSRRAGSARRRRTALPALPVRRTHAAQRRGRARRLLRARPRHRSRDARARRARRRGVRVRRCAAGAARGGRRAARDRRGRRRRAQ